MTALLLSRDESGETTYGIAPATDAVQALMAINTIYSFTVPTAFKHYELHFSIDPGLRAWVTYDGSSPAVPSGSFVPTTSELNPAARLVAAGTVVKCITPDTTCEIGVTMYGK